MGRLQGHVDNPSAAAAAIAAWMAQERESRLPEFLQTKPKYHYYNAWMRGRIEAVCGALPEPVVTKMLATDADDLDLMLNHPVAAVAQVRSAATGG